MSQSAEKDAGWDRRSDPSIRAMIDAEKEALRSAEFDARPMADAEALRDHLDTLNDAGTDFRAVGVDAAGAPFMIALSGPYAEAEQVIYGDPWDSEVDWGTGRRCEECYAANLHQMDSLRFPVVVLARPIPPTEPTP